MSKDIQFAAILLNNEFMAELKQSTHDRANLRNVVLSIAAQASPGDVACVTTNKVTGYYIKRRDGIISVALANSGAPGRVVLLFLRKVEEELAAAQSRGSSPQFQQIIEAAATHVQQNRDSIHLAQVEVDKVKQIMVENIDRFLERGERVSLLVDRTGEMSHSANLFNRQATQLQRKMWYQNVKYIIMGFTLLALVAFIGIKII